MLFLQGLLDSINSMKSVKLYSYEFATGAVAKVTPLLVGEVAIACMNESPRIVDGKVYVLVIGVITRRVWDMRGRIVLHCGSLGHVVRENAAASGVVVVARGSSSIGGATSLSRFSNSAGGGILRRHLPSTLLAGHCILLSASSLASAGFW